MRARSRRRARGQSRWSPREIWQCRTHLKPRAVRLCQAFIARTPPVASPVGRAADSRRANRKGVAHAVSADPDLDVEAGPTQRVMGESGPDAVLRRADPRG